MVSVIIPAYNSAEDLDQVLSSFFAKSTRSPVELIIVDQGSTDNTSQIAAKYAIEKFIRYIKRDRNSSFFHSCNYDAARAQNPYLLFLTLDGSYSDDFFFTGFEKNFRFQHRDYF